MTNYLKLNSAIIENLTQAEFEAALAKAAYRFRPCYYIDKANYNKIACCNGYDRVDREAHIGELMWRLGLKGNADSLPIGVYDMFIKHVKALWDTPTPTSLEHSPSYID